eukprot:1893366-Pleurochrysis_carterae.AAC.1
MLRRVAALPLAHVAPCTRYHPRPRPWTSTSWLPLCPSPFPPAHSLIELNAPSPLPRASPLEALPLRRPHSPSPPPSPCFLLLHLRLRLFPFPALAPTPPLLAAPARP